MPEETANTIGDFKWLIMFVPIIGLFLLGIWMGVKERLVVFSSYFDVFIVGLLYMIPGVAFGIAIFTTGGEHSEVVNSGLFLITLCLEGVVLLFILIKTWIDNPNPIKALLAFYVKVPLGVFFFGSVFGSFDKRPARDRRKSILRAILIAPLIHALVQNKKRGRLPNVSRRI